MLIVPTASIASQTVDVVVNNQIVQLAIYQKVFGVFMDVYVNNQLIIGGVLCLNVTRIVRSLYLGFSGDFIWYDTQGTSQPYYTGIGSRYLLVYLSPSDLPAGEG
jgi:hypothetical protein